MYGQIISGASALYPQLDDRKNLTAMSGTDTPRKVRELMQNRPSIGMHAGTTEKQVELSGLVG
jgi:hypothetical protein